jgi:hypothetical protein
VDERDANIIEELQTRASNSLVDGLRTNTMERTIIAVGTIGVFEALLQRCRNWPDAFPELDKELRRNGRDDLADRFRDYRDAINVLKHGEGRSYEQLLARKNQLPFTVKDKGQAFFDEGDVSEITRLVDVDSIFITRCIDLIDEIKDAIGITRLG